MRVTSSRSPPTARPHAVGWLVFRATPWAVLGPYPRFEDAVWRAESLGPRFRIAFGVRQEGVDDFVPVAEPDVCRTPALELSATSE
ncbi:MAG: hypothetical protein FD124_1629 [Alphaproteobacteria bacterium]|nr:MAG: hypothetical protein FD124_1629 [Alphaproteobacteria bacterium]